MPEVRIFTSDRCLSHEVPRGFPECPERLLRARSGLAAGWSVAEVGDQPGGWASRARVLAARVHDARYLERFEAEVRGGARSIDTDDNPVSPGTPAATWAATEVCLSTAEWAEAAPDRHGFALTRPPGHHAERDRAMGFCFLNHVAIVARALLEQESCERVAIVDFDVHHGNGTQHLFEADPQVYYLSLHQAPFYPGTGAARERGVGEGVGRTLNLPLPAGTGGELLLDRFEAEVLPEIDGFAPDALLVSAGFDAWLEDPLGGMALRTGDFEQLGRQLAAISDRHCDGRMVSILEGGYDLEALPELIEGYLRGTAKLKRSTNS